MSSKSSERSPAGGRSTLASLGLLLLCVSGIYTCYLVYGVFQEALYKKQDDGTSFGATAFVLSVQCIANAVVAALGMGLEGAMGGSSTHTHTRKDKPAAPGAWLSVLFSVQAVQTASVYVLAMYTSNEALKYVSYPLQALAKSCKMIPVLIGSVVILGKRYNFIKYVCVLLMTAGITVFQWGGGKSKGHGGGGASDNETFGLLLLAGSLALDGVTGPMQEQLKDKLTNTQQIIVNNVWAAILMAVIAAVRGEIAGAITYLQMHPNLLTALGLFSLTSAFGQLFVFFTIRTFDSLTLSTITTTRKFFTIVASVVVYGHSLSATQWGAVATVFAGIVLEVVDGEREKAKKKRAAAAAAASAASSTDAPTSPARASGKLHSR